MRIISQKALKEFWGKHPNAKEPLLSWYEDTKRAILKTPSDIKNIYRNASILGNNRVVFNIKGNTCRLVVAVNYKYSLIYIRLVATHQEYDKVDAETI
jgi:mRNA interferase HigB